MKTTNKNQFLKPSISFNKQVEKLKSRGMNFSSEKKAIHYLSNLNYYRLRGYWIIFEKNDSHDFEENTCFDKVLDLYIFDRELRLLLLDAIERIEVSIRTKLSYYLTMSYGSHAHLKAELFYSPLKYSTTLVKLQQEIHRNKRIEFIEHHLNKYSEELPPLWVCVEVMTIGHLSNWYANIKDRKLRQQIAKEFNLDEKVLKSFLHHLTIIRNTAAHHSRVWNKKFAVDFILPNNPLTLKNKMNISKRKYIYNTLIMCDYLMSIICKNNHWMKKVETLIKKYSVDKKRMGYN